MSDPVELNEVQDSIDEGRLNSPDENGACRSEVYPRSWHIERIAWFCVHGWRDPIELDSRSSWPITDGNHRFAAAIFREDVDILTEEVS